MVKLKKSDKIVTLKVRRDAASRGKRRGTRGQAASGVLEGSVPHLVVLHWC